MIFFLSLLVLTGFAWLFGQLGVPSLRDGRACMRLALAIALVFFGVDHLLTPERYLAMIETWMPWPEVVIALTGLCEIAGGLGLLLPALRRWAGLLLAVYFIAVFPANVHNAVQGLNVDGLPSSQWYYWLRLAFQPLAVWWALYSAGILRWPFDRSTPLNQTPTTSP
ncbi:DoxX family protein [Marinobacter sp. LN3S78]|uniref:DoxX family protein n=1 Tax=Marinobacter sp. LN3S78 TaxID=3382300 RepID=UPI00387B9334